MQSNVFFKNKFITRRKKNTILGTKKEGFRIKIEMFNCKK